MIAWLENLNVEMADLIGEPVDCYLKLYILSKYEASVHRFISHHSVKSKQEYIEAIEFFYMYCRQIVDISKLLASANSPLERLQQTFKRCKGLLNAN